MSKWNSIKIVKGSGGWGGPIVVTPTEEKHKVVYVTGGNRPDIVDTIVELTGMEAIDGFKTAIPDEEIALAIVDCGGTLRCGIYPSKNILTVNVLPTGKSGPLAKYITPELYVSAVTPKQISLVNAEDAEAIVKQQNEKAAKEETAADKEDGIDTSKTLTQQGHGGGFIAKIGIGVGKVVATFNQAAKESVQTVLNTIIPFMAFVALLIGIIMGSGIGNWFAKIMVPLAGNVWGLMILGFICSLPFLSPLLDQVL